MKKIFLIVAMLAPLLMEAQIQIYQLPSISALHDSDLIMVSQNKILKKERIDSLRINMISTSVTDIKRSNDSVFKKVNGIWQFAFTDSVGGGGSGAPIYPLNRIPVGDGSMAGGTTVPYLLNRLSDKSFAAGDSNKISLRIDNSNRNFQLADSLRNIGIFMRPSNANEIGVIIDTGNTEVEIGNILTGDYMFFNWVSNLIGITTNSLSLTGASSLSLISSSSEIFNCGTGQYQFMNLGTGGGMVAADGSGYFSLRQEVDTFYINAIKDTLSFKIYGRLHTIKINNGSGSGTLTSFSSGNGSPLFTTSVATSTTTPSLTFNMSSAPAHTYYGDSTGSSGTPGFYHISTGDLPTGIPNANLATTPIDTLNGLTANKQTFATGTTGTDFGISSSSSTHTFNLPIASAINTGKLSSTDWTTFNNKQNTGATITLNAGTNTGYTIPGAMSLSSTYTFGSTSDNLRYNDLGLNVAAPTGGGQYSAIGAANGLNLFQLQRFKNTSPTGSFIRLVDSIGTTVLFRVSIAGVIDTGIWNATKIGLAYGGTNADLSGTGGAANYLKQVSSGAAITVGTIPFSDLVSTPTTLSGYSITDAANINLSNLTSVNINTSLLAQTGVDAGSAAKPFRNIYFYGSSSTPATNNFEITGTSTSGTRTFNIVDADNSYSPQATSSTSHQWFTAFNTDGTFTKAQPADADIGFTDITTGNSSTSNHGFLLKLDNNSAHYMDGTGAWSTPAGGGTPCTSTALSVQYNNAGAFGCISGLTSNGTNMTAGSGNFRATRPQFTTSIDDANGNAMLTLAPVSSAVNNFSFSNDATTNHIIKMIAAGNSANIEMDISPLGTGNVCVTGGADVTKKLAFSVAGTTGITGTIATAFTTAKTATLLDNTGTIAEQNVNNAFSTLQDIVATATSSRLFSIGISSSIYRTTNGGGAITGEVGFYPNGKSSGILGWIWDLTQNGYVFGAGNSSSNMIARGAITLNQLTNTAGSETGGLSFSVKGANQAMAEALRLDTGAAGGKVTFDAYTTATSYTGTPLALLATNSSGNIIQEANGQIVGTNTNDNATAGNIGENLKSAGVSSYTNFTTTGTYQVLDSITITSGDWNIRAMITFYTNSATLTTTKDAIFAISTTSASAAGATEGVNIAYVDENLLGTTTHQSVCIASYDVKQIVGSSTKYYLNGQASFTVGNPQYVCSMNATRVR